MIDRRNFMRTGALALLALAAACKKKKPVVVAPAGSLDAIQGNRQQKVGMAWSNVEVLAKPGERLTFTLNKPGGTEPFQNATGSVWLARDRTGKALGPFPMRALGNGFEQVGLYVAVIDVPTEGTWTALVDARIPGADAQIGGTAVLVGATNDQVKPGERAVKVPTPTVSNHRGVDPYCTSKPPCSMHRISLDEALKNGKPTVVIIATPAFCQSRLCGPEVSMLESVAKENAGRANFIHIENFKDDKPDTVRQAILSPAAAAWKLETEPATYWIGTDGIVRERALGPNDVAGFQEATTALLR